MFGGCHQAAGGFIRSEANTECQNNPILASCRALLGSRPFVDKALSYHDRSLPLGTLALGSRDLSAASKYAAGASTE